MKQANRPRTLPLLVAAAALAVVTTVAANQAKVSARSGLNLRKAPSAGSRRLDTLRPGEQVTVVSKQGKWTEILTQDGKRGWAFGKYLRDVPGERRSTRRTPANRPGLVHLLGGRDGDAVPISDERGTTAPAATRSNNRSSGRSSNTPRPVSQRNLSGLQPGFRRKVENVLARLQMKGWQPHVAEGRRTRAQQREKVRRGVSRTMNSRHLTGLAADIVDRRYGWGGPARRQSFQFWKDLGAAARAEGLTWGGNWRTFKDVAHVQN